MTFFRAYLRQRLGVLAVLLLFCGIFGASFTLYHLPLGAVLYPALLCLGAVAAVAVLDMRRVWKAHRALTVIRNMTAEVIDDLPRPGDIVQRDYQMLVESLCRENRDLQLRAAARYADMVDYYTLWAHQIKTPIASMRLTLQNEDTDLSRDLSRDLFRVEQYVEMVMAFLRLTDGAGDYVFRQCDLDGVIRQAVRKFAPEFIRRRIRLVYEPVKLSVVTDEKWLGFVLEQILSNALKYTRAEGTITIGLEEDGKTLFVADTGIGIAPEDLPRIFEKGYTGYNGRRDRQASGIGLYLCRRICDNLGVKLAARSVPEQGTTVTIGLDQHRIEG